MCRIYDHIRLDSRGWWRVFGRKLLLQKMSFSVILTIRRRLHLALRALVTGDVGVNKKA